MRPSVMTKKQHVTKPEIFAADMDSLILITEVIVQFKCLLGRILCSDLLAVRYVGNYREIYHGFVYCNYFLLEPNHVMLTELMHSSMRITYDLLRCGTGWNCNFFLPALQTFAWLFGVFAISVSLLEAQN